MSDKPQRLSKLAKEFNVGIDTILEFLVSKEVGDLNRNSKVSADVYEMLVDEYQPDSTPLLIMISNKYEWGFVI